MNKYKIILSVAVLGLLLISLFTFVLFRHIEIRKVEFENAKAVPNEDGIMPKKKRHTKTDDILILLRVLLVLVILAVLIDEGSRWLTILISYVLVLIVSLLFVIKGRTLPASVKDRKWEYLALFSVLLFSSGACIALIGYCIIAMAAKYGSSYYGPARIVGYSAQDDDAVNDDAVNADGGDGGNRRKLDDGQADEGEADADNEGEANGDNEGEGEADGDNEGEANGENEGDNAGENEADEENNNDHDGGEDENKEDENEDEDHDDEEEDDHEDEEDNEEQNADNSAQEYAKIQVSWGGEWGCPSSPSTYCTAVISTPCDLWDLDEVSGYNVPADWKYWNGDVDSHLYGQFSCGNGFEDGAEDGAYNPDYSPLYNTTNDDAYDEFPYAYIVGDCNTCEASWAWTSAHRRYEKVQGYNSLYKNYFLCAGVALIVWAALSFKRKVAARRRARENKAQLLKNEGGTMA